MAVGHFYLFLFCVAPGALRSSHFGEFVSLAARCCTVSSPIIKFCDCGHSFFWNLYSTFPVDVVRSKSEVKSLSHDP